MRHLSRGWPVAIALVMTLALAQAPALRVTTRARALQPGDVVQFTIQTTQSVNDVRLEMFGRSWPPSRVDARTWHALVGIDLDTTPGAFTAVVSSSGSEKGQTAKVTRRLTVVKKAFGTRTLTVDDAFVNPPAELSARIAAESARLAEIWKREPSPRAWTAPFTVPVTDPPNSAFGKRSVFNGQVRNAHTGADFPSQPGTPVAAPNAGVVVLADELYYSGNTVIVDHGLGLFSTFAHLSAIDVRSGDVLVATQVVGKVGATGRVTGPHLHWAVRLNGARVDPLSLVWVTSPREP